MWRWSSRHRRYEYEHFFREMESKYPGRVCAYLATPTRWPTGLYAASDLFLMPSKFEPCGISQMIAMRYGTLPIVRETGGLRDTVFPYDEQNGPATAFRLPILTPTTCSTSSATHCRTSVTRKNGAIGQIMPLPDNAFAVSAEKVLYMFTSIAF